LPQQTNYTRAIVLAISTLKRPLRARSYYCGTAGGGGCIRGATTTASRLQARPCSDDTCRTQNRIKTQKSTIAARTADWQVQPQPSATARPPQRSHGPGDVSRTQNKTKLKVKISGFGYGLDDVHKLWLHRCPADKESVDIGLCRKLRSIFGVRRSTILDTNAIRDCR